jgi:hypothetical protein
MCLLCVGFRATDYVDADFNQPRFDGVGPFILPDSPGFRDATAPPMPSPLQHQYAANGMNGSLSNGQAASHVRVGNVVIPKAVLASAGVSVAGGSTTAGGSAGSSPPMISANGINAEPAVVTDARPLQSPPAPPSQRAAMATAAALRAVDTTGDEDLMLAMQLQHEEEQRAYEQRQRALQDEQLIRQLQEEQVAYEHQLQQHQQPPPRNGHSGRDSRPPHGNDPLSISEQQRALDYYHNQKAQKQQRQQQESNCVVC